jgi:hypothetical protein
MRLKDRAQRQRAHAPVRLPPGPRGVLRQDIGEKVLERLATSDKTTIVIERQPDGKNASNVRVLGRGEDHLSARCSRFRNANRRRLATCDSQNQALRRLGPALCARMVRARGGARGDR